MTSTTEPQRSADLAPEAVIAAIETGLTAALHVHGEPVERHTIAERMQRFGVPGMSIAVINDGRIELVRHYGSRASGGGKVDDDTLFQAASISKAVSAVGVLALVEQGLFGLDDDVNDHLRSFRLGRTEAAGDQPVTVRRLLSHTAGTSVPGFPGYPVGSTIPAAADVLAGVGSLTPTVVVDTPPGTISRYSGGGTTVVQQLVADVTGRDYATVIHELVLAPLGMADSAFDQPVAPERAHRTASGHTVDGQPMVGGCHVYPELAAAGLWTTARDLATFVLGVQRMLSGHVGPISTRMAHEMVNEVGPGPYGLGPELGGTGSSRRFFHNGTNRGFCSQFVGFVERPAGLAVMTNGDGGNTLLLEVMRSIGAAHGWDEFAVTPIATVEIDPDLGARYAGRYVGPFDRPMTLHFEDGVLFSPAGYGRRRLLPLSETEFIDEETGATLVFRRVEGIVESIAVLVGGDEIMSYRPAESAA